MDMFAHDQSASDTAQWLHQLQHAPNTVEPPSTASWNSAQEQNMMAGPSSLQPHTHQHQADMSMGFGDLSNGQSTLCHTCGPPTMISRISSYLQQVPPPARRQTGRHRSTTIPTSTPPTYPETSLSNWNIPPAQSTVPHSSYSTLNGAVTPEPPRRSNSAQETATQHSPPMAIEYVISYSSILSLSIFQFLNSTSDAVLLVIHSLPCIDTHHSHPLILVIGHSPKHHHARSTNAFPTHYERHERPHDASK
jgi:hypothetical protein